MNNNRDDQERLREELHVVNRAFGKEAKRLLPKWRLSFGPVVLQSSVDPENIARIYILFNIACLVAGIILIFFKGTFQVLGIALIVGGLFSFGAFVAQLWTVAVQRGHETLDRAIGRAYDDEKYAELRRLAAASHELRGKLTSRAVPETTDEAGDIPAAEQELRRSVLGPPPPATRVDTTTDTSDQWPGAGIEAAGAP